MFKEEDPFISFFAFELFQYDSHHTSRQDLEDYSAKLLKKFVEEGSSQMFIGFCFPTLQDSGHSNRHMATGSTSILLLALARGLTKLLLNIANRDSVSKLQSDFERGKLNRKKELDHKLCFTEGKQIGRYEIRKPRMMPDDKFYIGGDENGIMVEVKFTKILGSLIVLCCAVLVMFVVMYWLHEREKRNSVTDYFQLVGSILEVCISLATVFIALVKAIYRKWDISGIINWKRNCKSLTELIEAMKGSNYLTRRKNAIRLCSTLPKPDIVFSYDTSWIFTNNGNGRFFIDDDIDVSDLENAGYKFGVTFYGEPIIVDARGNVRNFYPPRSNYDNTLYIAENHQRQSGFIFCLPTLNKFVGSGREEEENLV